MTRLRYGPRMLRPRLSLILLFLACGPDGDSADTTAASSGTTTAATADVSTGAPTSSAGTTTAQPSTSTTVDASTAGTASTGDPAFCQGWETPDGAPYLVLHDRLGAELKNGGILPLECGAQGVFMFGLYPTFGGFVPPGDILDFQLVVDVEGFNNNPEGHFYSANPVGYYVSCDPVLGGVLGVLPVFPLDNLANLMDLDGKPAKVHVIMPTGDEPVAVDLDLTLSVVPGDDWMFCGG